MRIIVIGAGFGGLSAAIRLQAQGHEVTIVEKRDRAGGRAYVFRQDGFVFDAGPTIITAPAMIEELFALAGRRTSDSVRLVALDPHYNVRFEDGSVFRSTGDHARLRSEVRRFNERDVDGYERFSEVAQRVFDSAFPLVDQPFTTVTEMVRVLPELVKLRADRSVAHLARRFFDDDRLRQVFSFHPLLIGGNPFQSSSIYALIHVLEKKWGVWFAMGGTGALVDALVRLFQDLGGEIRLETEAGGIDVDPVSGRARGVYVGAGERLPADAVISNADVAFTYRRLVPSVARRVNTDRRLDRMRYSMSLFVIYFGTDRRYDDIAHHEILMGPRYEGLLRDIFHKKRLAEDFSLYLHRPTATDRSLAPPGCDSWYVLSPVPHLGGTTDWSRASGPYRDAILEYLERRYLPGLRRHIVTEHRVDPRYFHETLNSHLGSAFSIEPILTQSAWFRPHNVSEDVPNLYLVGAGTHPGAGVPGVLSSGKIVADMIGAASGPRPSARQNATPMRKRAVP